MFFDKILKKHVLVWPVINKNKKSLRILLTNHHLISYQGSENFTYTIADYLVRNGHRVWIYSAYVGQLKEDFKKLGIQVVSDIRLLKENEFDIAHVHHQINAYEVRYYFPHLPIVLLCHGVVFLENPPSIDLNISQYLATSERVKECMVVKGVAREKISIFRNMVDSEKFYPLTSINTQPKRAVIVSNKVDIHTENIIRQACKALNIQTLFIGDRFIKLDYKKMPSLLNEADIVFSLGRGVIEAMFCGRIPIIFDYEGGDGMVTQTTLEQNMTCNFSGNVYNAHYTVEDLKAIIRSYHPEEAIPLREKALHYFEASTNMMKLLDIYHHYAGQTVDKISKVNQDILTSIVTSIAETRSFTHHYHNSRSILYSVKFALNRGLLRAKYLFNPFF